MRSSPSRGSSKRRLRSSKGPWARSAPSMALRQPNEHLDRSDDALERLRRGGAFQMDFRPDSEKQQRPANAPRAGDKGGLGVGHDPSQRFNICKAQGDIVGAWSDPGLNRNRKALLGGPGFGGGTGTFEPFSKDPLSETALHLEPVWEGECKLRDGGIKERRSALQSVGHQTAIELQQKIVGKPGCDVGPLGPLKRG